MFSPFEGDLVRLRAREESDLETMYRWANDWEMLQYLGRRYPISRADEMKWLTAGDPGPADVHFIIETKADATPIGFVGLNPVLIENREAELGIGIGAHEYLNGGYGTDAMRTVCRFAFDEMNLHRIELTVYDWNPRAIRCYEKVGFVREGIQREAIFRAGKWHNLVHMGLLKGELR